MTTAEQRANSATTQTVRTKAGNVAGQYKQKAYAAGLTTFSIPHANLLEEQFVSSTLKQAGCDDAAIKTDRKSVV